MRRSTSRGLKRSNESAEGITASRPRVPPPSLRPRRRPRGPIGGALAVSGGRWRAMAGGNCRGNGDPVDLEDPRSGRAARLQRPSPLWMSAARGSCPSPCCSPLLWPPPPVEPARLLPSNSSRRLRLQDRRCAQRTSRPGGPARRIGFRRCRVRKSGSSSMGSVGPLRTTPRALWHPRREAFDSCFLPELGAGARRSPSTFGAAMPPGVDRPGLQSGRASPAR